MIISKSGGTALVVAANFITSSVSSSSSISSLAASSAASVIGTSAATTTAMSTATTTTAATLTPAGYMLSPALTTVLANAPLLAFAFVQMSGIAPIQHILRQKQTFNYSPFPFVSLITNCSLWTLYGYLSHDNTIFYANLAGILAGITYTTIFHRYTSMRMAPYYIVSSSLLSVLFGTSYWMVQNELPALTMLGSIGSASAVILMASPLAAIQQVRKDQSTESMSLMMSTAMTCNGISWLGYGWFVTGDPFVYVPNALGFMAGLLQLSLFKIYPSRKKI